MVFQRDFWRSLFCIKVVVKLIATYLPLKLVVFNETCKMPRPEIAAKTLMNLSSSMIKVESNREAFSHEIVNVPGNIKVHAKNSSNF